MIAAKTEGPDPIVENLNRLAKIAPRPALVLTPDPGPAPGETNQATEDLKTNEWKWS
jgi:hypothetical protein